MNKAMDNDLKRRLLSSEDQWVERKEALPKERDIRKALVAFANSVREGEESVLFIGISDKGHLKGITNPDDAQMTIEKNAKQECYPPIECRYRVLDCQNETGVIKILAVIIPYSQRRPHFSGRAYVRRGSQSFVASEEVFRELIASQNDTARRLLQFKEQKVSLRWQSISGFFFDCEVIIQACDAHSVQVKDNWGNIWELPIPKIHFANDTFRKIKIFAPIQWTEPQQIQKILRMSYQYLPAKGPVHIKKDDYLVTQLLSFPHQTSPIVSSEMDGTSHQALKTIHVLLKFEMKKLTQQRTHIQKQREVQQIFRKAVNKGGFPSNIVLLSAATEAILEVSTSFEEIDEFLVQLFSHNADLWPATRQAVRAAIDWQLGLA